MDSTLSPQPTNTAPQNNHKLPASDTRKSDTMLAAVLVAVVAFVAIGIVAAVLVKGVLDVIESKHQNKLVAYESEIAKLENLIETHQVGAKYKISIVVTSQDMETALGNYTRDVYVDTADRDYQVDGQPAFKVVGTVLPDMKRVVTVVTKGENTYSFVLDARAEASFGEYQNIYDELISSIELL